ncbi:MAG TPA: hypothetical protein VFN30_04380 [Chitinophagaceae bacterium]|nr:hypothetical protein [Chitinophagaceae bacterium]
MARKKWTPKSEVTSPLLSVREKRKWQIAFRRYVLEQQPSFFYAPFFALDIKNIRKWLELQFEEEISWENFGSNWQFSHVVPVIYFDFSLPEELKLCWNFINIRVERKKDEKNSKNRWDILGAKGYFNKIYKATGYEPCIYMLEKIDKIELSQAINTEKQEAFIKENSSHINLVKQYSALEFEMLNNGKSIEEIKRETDFLNAYKLPGNTQ